MDEEIMEIREVLVRLDAKVQRLFEILEGVVGETGLPRCAERGQRLTQCEARLKELAGAPGTSGACVEQRGRLVFLERKLDVLAQRLWWFASAITLSTLLLALRSVWALLTG